MKKNRFNIDFFEFAFLVEACVPPRPIARTMFFHRVIDEYYYVLTEEERKELFKWITKLNNFDEKEEDCRWFKLRYAPYNQYEVETNFNGKKETYRAFLKDSLYHIKRNTWIEDKYIVNAKKLEL